MPDTSGHDDRSHTRVEQVISLVILGQAIIHRKNAGGRETTTGMYT
jgi:hypothetical protein